MKDEEVSEATNASTSTVEGKVPTNPEIELAVLTTGHTILRLSAKEVALTPCELQRLAQLLGEALAAIGQHAGQVNASNMLH